LDNPTPEILFYVIHVVSFVNGPHRPIGLQMHRAALSSAYYAAFELASMALLKRWKWAAMIPDTVWAQHQLLQLQALADCLHTGF
jgi:hypothetical protein